MPAVNHEILVWARTTAGLTEEEAIDRLGIQDSRGESAIDRLRALESGEVGPSRPMLIRMTKVYHQPLLLFYMTAPPRKGDRGQDFRTLPADYSVSDDALIDVLIRNIVARQSTLRAAMEDDDEVETLEFVGSAKIADGPGKIVELLKHLLQMDHKDFYAQAGPDKAFALLRAKAEKAGVFVLLVGNLGSYHTTIKLEVFRGFALADKIVPFIVINDQDSHTAWSFTLLHELTHILLGQSGISAGQAEKEFEKFCNDVASRFLLPGEEIIQLTVNNEMVFETALERISQFANQRNLSSSMVAYNLLRHGLISGARWQKLSEAFRDKWLQAREVNHNKAKEKQEKISYYVVRRHRVGTSLIKLINQMLISGSLSTTKAAHVLGVKAKNVQHIVGD